MGGGYQGPGRPGVERGFVRDIPALILEAGGYRAAVCPEMGANCFLLERGGASFLRTPPDFGTFRANPNVYGMPLLFPPNRVAGGSYTFQGRNYRLPVNEPARGHHIHGSLSSAPFALLGSSGGADAGGSGPGGPDVDAADPSGPGSCRASFGFRATREAPYLSFPHEFSVEIEYGLGPGGLSQRLKLTNEGGADMPTGLGFHTALACPFLPGTEAGDYRLGLGVGEQLLLDPNTIIPTGKAEGSNELIAALRAGLAHPQGPALSAHFRADAALGAEADSEPEAALRHLPSGRTLVYRVDPRFAFWTLWNSGGASGFVCPEPQTWTIDAPNSPLPPRESGFFALPPGGSLILESSLAEA